MSSAAWTIVVDLLLTGGSHLVVRTLEREPGLDELEGDVVTQVGGLVDRAHREVAALVRGLVGEVAALFLTAGVPRGLLGVDLVEALAGGDRVADVVEDVELRLGGEEGGVGDAGRGQVLLGLLGDLTRVLRVDLAGARVVDVEEHDERARLAERVDVRRRDVGDELHVRLVDAREAADRGTVEQLAVGEESLVDRRCRNVEVLLNTREIGEADVKELDVVLLDVGQYFGRIFEHVRLL
jgi:hypothetical protein